MVMAAAAAAAFSSLWPIRDTPILYPPHRAASGDVRGKGENIKKYSKPSLSLTIAL